MNRVLQSFVLLLALLVPTIASAGYEQLAEGVYQDGSTLYIGSGVTSLGDLQVNPSEIYCYATIPPACMSNTFTGYDAILHVPAAGMVSYFTTQYWYNFNNILSDAIEPLSVTMNISDAELEIGQQLLLSASVAPNDATPKTVYWSSSDASVATVSAGGTVTAVATGECDIFATCVDKVAVCHVTVVPPRVTITLDKHEALLLPNHTMTLTATCSPIDVDLAVTSSNPGVAIPRLVNGTIMVVGVSEGTATITVNAADGWGHPDSCVVTVYTEHGDVNCDGYVNISDVTKLIDYLLSANPEGLIVDNADTNMDGHVNISDVTTLIDYLLSGRWPWEPDEPKTETFTVNGVSFTMVAVEGGSFMMGASDDDTEAHDNEKPAHQVTLSSYSIGQTEVTQALWYAVMGYSTNDFTGDENRPVGQVSWNDCQTFITKLNEMTGMQFRLPTEAEWEYAARGGNKSKGYTYAGSDNIEEVAWHAGNSNHTSHPVGSKKANELGLFDMSGNVYEWCQDWYGDYGNLAQTNPTGPSTGSSRVARGGTWFIYASTCCRVTDRSGFPPDGNWGGCGLRLAIDDKDSPKFRLSETVIIVKVGESKSIDIINGGGSYTIEGGADNVSCTFNGNSLIVTGIHGGITTSHITNTITGATTVLTIVVDEHEYVDLGLPSGTLWATCNVGADTPEDYGDYFAWGETEPKEVYSWETYKWCNGTSNTLTKYCTDSSFGTVDSKTELDPEDDAAYVNWGSLWRMPTLDQQKELIDNCTWTWTTQNGVNGQQVTGPNGNTMFLPAAGNRWGSSQSDAGSGGYYWLRTLYYSYPDAAYLLNFSSSVYWNIGSRYLAYTVRAVRESQN